MENIFVDESIHDRGGFIVVAAVYAPHEVDTTVRDALAQCGFVAGLDEFKSSAPMADDPSARRLRERIAAIVSRYRIAVVVAGLQERDRLVDLVFELIGRVGAVEPLGGGVISFDQGMGRARNLPPPGWSYELGCDSRVKCGIQLADYAAHTVATMLLGRLGLVSKTVTTDDQSFPQLDLPSLLWASMRHSLAGRLLIDKAPSDGRIEPMMLPFGLLTSDGCPAQVRDAVQALLGEIWIGCIH